MGQPFGISFRFLPRMAQIGTDAVLFLGMGRAQPGEPHQPSIHLCFFDHERITGSDGLDFGVGQGRRVEVFHTPNGHIAGHHLGDELGLGFQRLPHIGVK